MNATDDKWYQDRGADMKFTHEFEMVMSPTGFMIPIDKPMVPIVQSIWKMGKSTQFCCEDLNVRGRAQVIFQDFNDAVSIAKILMIQDDLGTSVEGDLILRPMRPLGQAYMRMELTWRKHYTPFVSETLVAWSGLELKEVA